MMPAEFGGLPVQHVPRVNRHADLTRLNGAAAVRRTTIEKAAATAVTAGAAKAISGHPWGIDAVGGGCDVQMVR